MHQRAHLWNGNEREWKKETRKRKVNLRLFMEESENEKQKKKKLFKIKQRLLEQQQPEQ